MTTPFKLILLDRDGVINQGGPGYVTSLDQFHFIPNSLEAVARLSQNGFKIALITNQGGVGRGLLSHADLGVIHQFLEEKVQEKGGKIHKIYYCPDHPNYPTYRRKPSPGMLEEAMQDFRTSPNETLMIGDDIRDFQAAQSANCSFYLVRTGHGEKTEKLLPQPCPIFANLYAAIDTLLRPHALVTL